MSLWHKKDLTNESTVSCWIWTNESQAWLDVTLAGGEKEEAELSCTVLVLGAGMAGVSAARRLRERGVEDVVVVEATDRQAGVL